jgi:HlyD family secretion protein
LIELNVTPGQKVQTGEVLARIDSTALERAVLQAEADLTVAQDDLEKTQNPYTELDVIQARLSVDQAEIALEEAKESLEEVRDPYTELDLIQARQTVSQTELALQEAKENLSTVLNPDTGLAALQNGPDALELLQAEAQITQAEYDLAEARESLAEVEAGPDPKEIELAQAKVVSAQATLEEAQAALEAATMIAPFGAFPSHRFSGQVLEVPLQGNLVQNVLTYEVPVSLERAAGVALKPGMTANLEIVVGRRQNALLVPALAVQQGEEGYVVLVQDTPQGSGVATPVQVGLSDGTYVEVVSGLLEGDRAHQPGTRTRRRVCETSSGSGRAPGKADHGFAEPVAHRGGETRPGACAGCAQYVGARRSGTVCFSGRTGRTCFRVDGAREPHHRHWR